MARETPKRLTERFNRALAIKEQWRDLLGDAYEYALPQRNLYFDNEGGVPSGVSTPGQKKVNRVFSSTAQQSTLQFANRMQTDMMPPFQRWLKFVAGVMVPEERKAELNTILERVREIFFAVLHSSNFDSSNNEVLLDLAVGTGAMLILEGTVERPVLFISVPASQITLESGPWDTVSAVFRFKSIKIRNIQAEWPDAKLSESLAQQMDQDNDAEIRVIEATYGDAAKIAVGDDTVWYYDVIEQAGDSNLEGARIVERDFDFNPWVTPRWIRVAGETYGRGPVVQALPDIKTENKIVEYILKNMALQISGVYTGVSGGYFNPMAVDIAPGVVIPVDSNGGTRGPSLQPLELSGNFNMADLELGQLRDNIKGFLLDNKLPPDTAAKVRSATEIIERIKELAKDIGSPFGRLITEYVQPVARNTLHILEKRGMIPKVKIDGLGVGIQILSPLAQEQNLNDVETLVRGLTIGSQFGQELFLLTTKLEEAIPKIYELMGIPPELVRSDQEKKQLTQAVAQLLAAQQQAEAPTEGNVTPIGAPGTVQPPSPEAAGAGIEAIAA